MQLRLRRVFAAFVLVALVAGTVPAYAGDDAPTGSASEVIVRFEDGGRGRALAGLVRRGIRVRRGMYGARGAVVEVPPGRSASSLAEELSSLDGVTLAAPNGRIVPLWTPNDSLYHVQWALPAIQMPGAWDVERGSASVRVAVIDTGAQISHPDLAANLDLTLDYDFADNDDVADDELGHGTHVAGIIAAVADNAAGTAGVAPGVRIVPIKTIGGSGSGSVSDLVDAIYYAADIGADVANMSLGEPLNLANVSDLAEARVMQEAVDYARAHDVVLVGATGNDGSGNVYYPAACDGVISVAAVSRSNTITSYSNHGAQVDIAAPGGDFGYPSVLANGIISTYPTGIYKYLTGTSMASPHVAGAAALLRSHEPAALAEEIEDSLLYSALDIGAAGWDEFSGHGLLQVADALAALDVASLNVARVSGSNRYNTALALSGTSFGPGESTVTVLASGEDFPDALAASGLAGAHRGALLLTTRTGLPAGLLAELERLGSSDVVLVGGPAAISPEVEEALMADGLTVSRVQGSNRYATAAAVAEEIRDVTGSATLPAAFLVRGDGYADALAVAPLAYADARPVLLTRPDALAPDARIALESLETTGVIIAGGESAVSPAALIELQSVGGIVGIERWAGADRYDTAAVVAGKALDAGLASPGYFGVATGVGFADALAGGVTAGARGGVLLLTDPQTLPVPVVSLLAARGYDGADVVVYGGTLAISRAVEDALARIRY
ncbi:MAG: S8 family serine peptidase [Coriobacteriia bacterium]